MNLSEQLDHLQQELDEQYKLLNDLKKQVEDEPKLEVGRWYKGTSVHGNDFLGKYTPNENSDFTIGFWKGNWAENKFGMVNKERIKKIRKATKDEIKRALVKEAKRRGLKEDNKIATPKHGHEYTSFDDSYDYKYYSTSDELYCHGTLVYTNGSWGELVQQNKIRDYTVTHEGGEIYKVGCEELHSEFLETLATLTKKHDIKIELEGHDVTNDIQNLKL